MRTSELKQSILSILRITAVIGCFNLFAFAQTPSPTPSPAPAGRQAAPCRNSLTS
jgi:hypothetical protein